MCFPQHVVTVELDTSCKGLLLINSVFIVTKIQKRPKKLHYSFSEEYFPDSTVQIFFAKSSEGTSPVSIVKAFPEQKLLGIFSCGIYCCPLDSSLPEPQRRRHVQPGGQWEWWDGGFVLPGDKLPAKHFQVTHQQLSSVAAEANKPLLLTQLCACSIPASVYKPPRRLSFLWHFKSTIHLSLIESWNVLGGKAPLNLI